MKKKRLIIGAIAILLLLIIPIPTGVLKDGGTRSYTALTYKLVRWNHLHDGGRYQALKIYPFPLNLMSIDALLSREEPYFQTPAAPQIDTYGVGTQYIHTPGPYDATYPKTVVIRSRQELMAYYETQKDTYFLARRENYGADYTIGFLDACDRYDDAYFENRILVLVLLQEPSGSNRHQVSSVVKDDTGMLNIRITSLIPEAGDCDMAQWHLFIEPAAGVQLENDTNINLILSQGSR